MPQDSPSVLMTHRAITIALLFALVSATAQGAIAAEDADVTANRTIRTQPLPHERVNSVFEEIARRERVEGQRPGQQRKANDPPRTTDFMDSFCR